MEVVQDWHKGDVAMDTIEDYEVDTLPGVPKSVPAG